MLTTLSTKIFPQYNQLPKKVQILYPVTFLGELFLIIPIWMFFYLKFLTYEEIALIVIVQQITMVLCEVPTGAFADMFGKKLSLILSYLLYAVSLLLIPLGSSLAYFIVLEIVRGVAKALYSGSFEALTYDSLKEEKLEESYPAVVSNFITISWVAYIFAGITGGALYDIWYGLPYLVLSVLYFINLVLIIVYTKEPAIDSQKVSLRGYIKQNLQGFEELFANSKISMLTIILATISLGYYVASELLGISQGSQYGYTGTEIGIVFSVGYVFSAILSGLFTKILGKFSVLKIIVSTTVALLISFLLAKFVDPVIGASLIILRISSSSTFSNIRSVILNRNVSSKNRATALSSFALIYELGFVFIAFFAGSYITKSSPNDFALILGIGLLALLLLGSGFYVVISRGKSLTSKVN